MLLSAPLFLVRPYGSVLLASQRFEASNLASASGTLIAIALSYWGLSHGLGLWSVFWGTCLAGSCRSFWTGSRLPIAACSFWMVVVGFGSSGTFSPVRQGILKFPRRPCFPDSLRHFAVACSCPVLRCRGCCHFQHGHQDRLVGHDAYPKVSRCVTGWVFRAARIGKAGGFRKALPSGHGVAFHCLGPGFLGH